MKNFTVEPATDGQGIYTKGRLIFADSITEISPVTPIKVAKPRVKGNEEVPDRVVYNFAFFIGNTLLLFA